MKKTKEQVLAKIREMEPNGKRFKMFFDLKDSNYTVKGIISTN